MPVVEVDALVISSAEQASFEDVVAVRGTLEPASVNQVDATVTGTVDRIHVQNGAKVERGDPLLTLSNPTVELQLISERARIAESLSRLSNQEVELQKSLSSRRSELDTVEYDVRKTRRQLQETQALHDRDLVSQSALEQALGDVEYQDLRLKRARENLRMEEGRLESYGTNIDDARALAQSQIEALSRREDTFNVVAPRKGLVSGLELTIGQQVGEGTRLALIGDATNFRLSANVDEFYLNRVRSGGSGVATLPSGTRIQIVVSDVDATLDEGQFVAKLNFREPLGEPVIPGQTFSVELSIANDKDAVVISRDIYDRLPDRQFIYIVSQDGRSANRQSVRYGRKNRAHVEVLSGLQANQSLLSGYERDLTSTQIRLR